MPPTTMIEETRKVVLLSTRGDRPFEVARRTLLARLAAQDWRYQLQVLDAGTSVDAQRSQLKEATAGKPFVILLDALDSAALKPEVAEAKAAGIFMIGLGGTAADLGCHTVLTVDHRKLGQLAGELTLRALLAKNQAAGTNDTAGRVIEIRGDEESVESGLQHEGFESALKTAPGVVVVHDAPGGWTLAGGRDRTLDALRLQQSFDIVYAHNDLMALGAASALKDRRTEVMIIGSDGFRGSEGGLTLVGDGEIDATVYQPPLVDFAWNLLRKKADEPAFQPKSRYDMPLRTVLPKDVEDIRRNGWPKPPEL